MKLRKLPTVIKVHQKTVTEIYSRKSCTKVKLKDKDKIVILGIWREYFQKSLGNKPIDENQPTKRILYTTYEIQLRQLLLKRSW